MVFGFLIRDFKISGKKFLAVLLLFFPSFTWFFLFDYFLRVNIGSYSTDELLVPIVQLLFFVSIVISAIIGSMLSEKWNRRGFLKFWIFFSIIITALFAVSQGLIFFLILAVLAGASWGLGFPSSLAFLAESTNVGERARVSGILILITFVSIIFAAIVVGMFELGLIESIFVYIIVRAMSFLALLLDPFEGDVHKKSRWTTVFSTPGLWLFSLSWLMFSVSSGLFGLIELDQVIIDFVASGQGSMYQFLGVVISALFSGFAADRFGRKKVIMFGLITLGISYAFFSINNTLETFLLTKIIYGAAFGIIFVVYSLTVIGDLARNYSKEKFYALGVVVPLIVFMFFEALSGGFSLSIDPSLASSILSMILFISVIPLLYAPETLPIDKLRSNRLKKYLGKLNEVVKEEESRNENL